MAKKKRGFIELEWTCPNCGNENPGAKRVCGTCGTPQPDDVEFHQPRQQKLVEDEQKLKQARAGADIHCAYCEARNPATADSCSQCGSDLSEGAQREMGRVVGAFKPGPVGSIACDNCGTHNAAARTICHNCGASLPIEKPAPETAPPKKASSTAKKATSPGLFIAIIAGCIAISVLVWFVFFRTTDLVGRVVAVEWERSIAVEALGPDQREDWFDLIPSDAEDLSCYEEVRSIESDPPFGADYDEVCGTPYTVDTGGGFAEVVQDCEYHVYDSYCTYTVLDWIVIDTFTSSGADFSPFFIEPDLDFQQRLGEQTESYTCLFEADGSTYTYTTENLNEFLSCQVGSEFTLTINSLGGVVSITE